MKKLIPFILLAFSISMLAQAPANYYTNAEGKADAALKTALYGIISSGTVDKGYDGLYTIYQTSDRTLSGNVWDMYSTCTWNFGSGTCGNYSVVCDCYNREHSVPQSWFGSASPMKSDAFHVYPTDGKVNGQRSNYPYGEAAGGQTLSSKALGRLGASTFAGYSGTVFEPVDEYKGDFARTYFYFATRYENIMKTIGGESFNNSTYPAFPNWVINLFLKWHRNDPVSQKEITRNDAIFKHQKNRNPFIDYPNLAEFIWGDKKGIPWSKDFNEGPQILTPSNNSTIDLGNVPYQINSSIIVDVKAANLTGDLSLSLSGTNSSWYSISANTISMAEAHAGYQLTISCNPQALGLVSAVLNISGGGITPAAIGLKATSTDSFIALSATNITGDGFTANWTSSANATGYLLNVYSYHVTGTQAQTLLEENFNSDALSNGWTTPATNNYYSLKDESGSIRLASGSNNGVLYSPTIDLSSNAILFIRAKQYGSDTGAAIEVKINDDILTSVVTGKDYETFTVPIPETSANSTLTFTALKGKRVYIDNIKIATEGSVETPVVVEGYPKLVGTDLSYHVTNLQSDSTYFYTVTPQGNGAPVSSEIQVKTAAATGFENISDLSELIVYFAGNTLYVSNLTQGDRLVIYSVLGNKILETTAHSDQISIPFNYQGIYILQAINGNKITGSRKILIK